MQTRAGCTQDRLCRARGLPRDGLVEMQLEILPHARAAVTIADAKIAGMRRAEFCLWIRHPALLHLISPRLDGCHGVGNEWASVMGRLRLCQRESTAA
jgi:hypothetical protein